MVKKIVFGALGAVLVVAVVVGVAVTVSNSKHKVGGDFSVPSGDANNLASSSKSISALCAPTDYREVCENTLGSATHGSATIQDAVEVSAKAIAKEVESAFNLSSKLGEVAKDPANKEAFANCQSFFTNAGGDIQTVLSSAGAANISNEKVDDILTFISAAMAYGTGCTEDISDPDLKKSMDDGLTNLYQLSSNALTILTNLKDILESFSFAAKGRRLLAEEGNVYERDAEGYPTWLAPRDRKLLGRGGARPTFNPNVVVAQDGSGQFRTINDALKAMPKNFAGRYVIYVKAGVYKEYVTVQKNNVNVLMYGDGSRKTIVTGSKNAASGTPTSSTAPFTVLGAGFICMYMGFSNTAGPKGHQAVALRVAADQAVFYRCRLDGYQDTLYIHNYRQFYRNCVISGTVDFIFGDATAVIQNSLILVRRPDPGQMNIVTAHGRSAKDSPTGVVIQNCRIKPDMRLFADRLSIQTYLGRPWRPYSRAVFMESVLGDLIQPAGFMPWDTSNQGLDTLYYAEYGNSGPGAVTGARVKWPGYHVLNRGQAQLFTVDNFLNKNDGWLKTAGVQYLGGLKY